MHGCSDPSLNAGMSGKPGTLEHATHLRPVAAVAADQPPVAAVPGRLEMSCPRRAVMYSPAIGDVGINEALVDSSLRTYVWLDGGIAFRKIKHFSGYNIYDGYRRMANDASTVIEADGLIIAVMY
jgi:hypothetical protein